ncbi:MAG: glycosyltransferase [Pseudomonadota bacterium]
MSYLKKGNRAFLNKKYAEAKKLYGKALNSVPELQRYVKFNLSLCDKRLGLGNVSLEGCHDYVKGEIPVVEINEEEIHPEKKIEIIRYSEYFDSEWYRSKYKDIRKKNADPLQHFLKNGGRERRSPGPRFDTEWYFFQYQDARESNLNPLLHFLLHGQAKGYLPLPPVTTKQWWGGLRKFIQGDVQDAHAPIEHDVLGALSRIEKSSYAVAVVIPVYNAPIELRACLNSVLRCSQEGMRVIVINDASSDPQVEDVFREFDRNLGFEFYSNEQNLGFTRTVNKGFSIAGRSDVLLLNSDTVVTPGWVRRLRLAAYSEPRVGTATPLSNNAGAFSVPTVGEKNEVPPQGLEAFSRAIAQSSLRLYPKVPTGNGFCMYIRRDCLDEIGGFDADAFPRGYGEENDFCMRAGYKGWFHIIDDATYIYHERSASFGNEKTELIKAGRSVLDERYPDYASLARAFVKSNEMETVRSQVQRASHAISRLGARVKPRVLYVLPDLSSRGGTPQTNQDLMNAISDRVETFLLKANSHYVELFFFSDGKYARLDSAPLPEPLAAFPHRSQGYDRIVANWIDTYSIELLHIRHIAWHGLGLIDVAKLSSVPVIFSFHDFYTICPTVKLLDENNNYCGGFCTATKGDCKYDLWSSDGLPFLKHGAIYEWKQVMQEALLKCDALVTTAESAKSIVLENFDMLSSVRFEVISHGRDFPEFVQDAAQADELIEPLRVIVPGNISYAKGADLIINLAKRLAGRVEFHILGRLTEGDLVDGIFEHGEYVREEFSFRVKEIRPHLGAVLSIWPETYCHTLTELWAAGIPVVGSPLGAVGERLVKTGAGWVPLDTTSEAIESVFQSILLNPSDILAKQSKVIEWQHGEGGVYNTGWMADQYHELYSEIMPASFIENAETLSTSQVTEPNSIISFREPLSPSHSAIELGTVSVIVPVHNALSDVQKCLKSVVENTFPAVDLVVIDDGSGSETAQWVKEFCSRTPHAQYHRNASAQGYTLSVNRGARMATGDVFIILNSDTILPPQWLERLVDPLLKSTNVAATGPVSNAATWQSVPHIRDADNAWANNVLPENVSVSDYDRFVQLHSLDLEASTVTLLNGFCYAVRASVFNEIGGLDEEGFPSGYGEETDFFLKIKNLGYTSLLVPNLFVFHNKSRSFGAERRKKLSAAGNEVLYARYGKESISAAANTLSECTALETLRARCAMNESKISNQKPKLRILFIMPVSAGGGGVHSVAQEAQGMTAFGHTVNIVVPQEHANSYEHYYPEICRLGVFITFSTKSELVRICKAYDVIVATHFLSIGLLKNARAQLLDRLFLYYVQDYEPWIVPESSPQFKEAFDSYTSLENVALMAKTRWICRMVENEHGVQVHKIAPSIDHSIYFPDPKKLSTLDNRPLTISAMIRPKTPRRGAQATINVLKELHEEFGVHVRIEIFGCIDKELNRLEGVDDFPLTNCGVLTREGVANLLRRSDLFVDMSSYQAFGRTAVEAMACGAAAVIPESGGGDEYSWAGHAALPVPTGDWPLASQKISLLVRDRRDLALRQQLGKSISSQFSIEKASASILSLIERHVV